MVSAGANRTRPLFEALDTVTMSIPQPRRDAGIDVGTKAL